ncbi:MAG: redox-sensing transcriptional repressor Rex [Thermodesulfobacteriota bacterium]|nr:redox-sensing transcriptional repressor Rex [Thermodesulfobacteriota bacterium]
MDIPAAVSSRFPMYYEYVCLMEEQGSEWISSNMMASALGLTSSTIRQDIQYIGRIRSSSFGYSTNSFRLLLEAILGIAVGANMALVGVGSLGSAILRYQGFRAKGFIIKAVFDKRKDLIGSRVNKMEVYPVGRMAEMVKRKNITIGVITTPPDVAQSIADTMVSTQIRGIWNFAPMSLRVPSNVALENVSLCPSLFSLSFDMKNLK